MSDKKMSQNSKTLVVVIIALLLILAMLGSYYAFIKPPTGDIVSTGEKTVTLQLEYKSETFEYKVKTDKSTVFDLLIEQNESCELGLVYDESEYGAFITALKSRPADNSTFYLFYVNDKYQMQGVSTTSISDGDTIRFLYASNVSWTDTFEPADFNVEGKLFPHQIVLIVFLCIVAVIMIGAIVISVVFAVKKNKKEIKK